MTVPYFAPLSALNFGNPSQKTTLAATVIESAGATAVIETYAEGPTAEHDLTVQCTDLDEVETLLDFFTDRLGACKTFWLPSYQRDFIATGPIACDTFTFDIVYKGYTDYEFPDEARRTLVFVFSDGMLIRRTVLAAVDNGDNTESLTLDEPLWREFVQQRNTGICFCRYGRFKSDTLSFSWVTHEQGDANLTLLELRNPPGLDVGSEGWAVSSNLASYVTGGGSVFGITAVFNGGIGQAGGYAYGEKVYQKLPNHPYTISGLITNDPPNDPWVSGLHITTTGVVFSFSVETAGVDQPFSGSVTTGADGLITIRVGRFDMEFGDTEVSVELNELVFDSECM